MADWGADVIKIERPEGDPMRLGRKDVLPPGATNPAFELDNRGKRSVVIDIQREEGRDILLTLLRQADVFVTNMRPRALKKARLDWETVRQENDRLIFASVTGYGSRGPDADLPGYDVAAFWARAGVAALMTPKGMEPFPLRTGVGDHTCALATAFAIMTALYERTKSGRGRLVETSLLQTGIYAVGADMALFQRIGRIASTRPRKATQVPLVNFYKTADDKWLCLMPRHARTDWPKITAVAGRPELSDDPRFATDRARRENTEALVSALDEAFGAMPFAELSRRLTEADIVWAPVQNAQEVAQDSQVNAAGCFMDMPDERGGSYKVPAPPMHFSSVGSSRARPAPKLGEHTEAVLKEAGLSPEHIAKLRGDNVVGATQSGDQIERDEAFQ